jgi:hypothetical protein
MGSGLPAIAAETVGSAVATAVAVGVDVTNVVNKGEGVGTTGISVSTAGIGIETGGSVVSGGFVG